MRKLIVFAVLAALAACSPKTENKDLAELHATRDSLQKVQMSVKKQLNTIEAEIAAADSSVNPEDLKIIKRRVDYKNIPVGINRDPLGPCKVTGAVANAPKFSKKGPSSVQHLDPEVHCIGHVKPTVFVDRQIGWIVEFSRTFTPHTNR